MDRERQRRAAIFTRLTRMKQDAEALEGLFQQPAEKARARQEFERLKAWRDELQKRVQG